MKPREKIYCSFCGKSSQEVERLIAAATCFICDECVELCAEIIAILRQEAFAFSHDMTVGDDSR